jgi:hypothetical protein
VAFLVGLAGVSYIYDILFILVLGAILYFNAKITYPHIIQKTV